VSGSQQLCCSGMYGRPGPLRAGSQANSKAARPPPCMCAAVLHVHALLPSMAAVPSCTYMYHHKQMHTTFEFLLKPLSPAFDFETLTSSAQDW
jgi:hypothetical protein